MTNIREKIDLVGKLETLQSIVSESHSSNGIITKYINAFKFRKDVDTAGLVHNMLREFKAYDWLDTINEFCEVVMKDMEENSVGLALESTLFSVRSENRFNSYDGVITILEGLVSIDDLDNDTIFSQLGESTWVPAVKNLFSIVESITKAPSTENPDVTINKVYSPIDVIQESEDVESYIFNLDGRTYKIHEGVVTENQLQTSPMFNKLLAVCEAFSIKDDKMTIVHKAHTIEILLGESNEVFVDGNSIPTEHLSSTLSATGSFYINEMEKLNLIEFAAQNASKIVELDFATKVTSNVYEGVDANIMKLDESIFINTVNRSMMQNELIKAEDGNGAVAMVKEFVNYDISNIVSDVLDGDAKFAQEILESRNLIEERIEFLNEQIGTIVEAEGTYGTSDELNEAKKILNDSLTEEKANLSTLLTK